MSDPFLGEIRPVGFNFAPVGWALCDGQIMSISQNTALFSLLGTNFGGNGVSTFGLPNLQGCFPLHAGQGNGLSTYVVGQSGGTDSVTLTQGQMAAHSHVPQAAIGTGSANSPDGAVWAQPHLGRVLDQVYDAASGQASMSPSIVGTTGGSQPHNNLSPYLVINFVIALQGIFPSRN
jgi:microcystin-dependent protein